MCSWLFCKDLAYWYFCINFVENRAGPSNLGNVISQILLCKQFTPDFNEEELCSITKDSQDIAMLLSEMQEYMPQHEAYLGEFYAQSPLHYALSHLAKVQAGGQAKILLPTKVKVKRNAKLPTAISIYVFTFLTHTIINQMLWMYTYIYIYFSFILPYRTQCGAGYKYSVAGKATSELYMQEHEPTLLRVSPQLSLRGGRNCLILNVTHSYTHYLYQLLVFKLSLKLNTHVRA